jgi:cytochrome oxidase Cu insertion factor (SCO1/SenC/PrrC family)
MGISSAHFVRCALLIVAFAGLAVSQNKPLPKPQVADAEGKAAPDFTLRDQDGKDFRLSDHHGERLLLYFYRGYW